MLNDPWFILAAVIAVSLIGLAKGGFAGLGTLGTPILALVISPVAAAGILLPILIVQDVVSVWSFRHAWDRWIVGWMMPGAVIGVVLGWAFAEVLPVSAVLTVLGGITLIFGLWRLWVERGGRIVAATNSPGWVGSLFGVAMGFTSQVAHAGAPPFQIWVGPRRLPHLFYVGTSSVTFAILNWVKVPAYIALGEFTRENLTISAMLIPVAIASTLAGVWLVRRIDAARFYGLMYLLMVLLGAKLLWDGMAALV
ncbi:sulfite exporter TauE/SafE family protein [Tsuneonella sp. CC-YZS046]|uniref:sulfite exporter TauE/SafE family protein n=1 Tax=Tsuneonella sp. CC-YZS046 TaxID=3042152 RepID=UPI002D7A3574|nr:sulfite exporter TauE/SafE family protein [Tsuneonella sp. CC-YZS046]WRO67136.1 sulfite exporter TauE/SafE family protein [Tsuneonella sp. CC-YZS046]